MHRSDNTYLSKFAVDHDYGDLEDFDLDFETDPLSDEKALDFLFDNEIEMED
jgi:hypothetical protein